MATNNEQVIRELYRTAEGSVNDVKKYVSLFTEDGTLNDESAGRLYRGKKEVGIPVELYAKAFPDMHREIYRMDVFGDLVLVELSLNGTHTGPLVMPAGTLLPTGKKMTTPCCDVFRLKDGKVQSFNCYVAATVLLAQIGVLGNMQAALEAGSRMT